jgi:hypothetical protein
LMASCLWLRPGEPSLLMIYTILEVHSTIEVVWAGAEFMSNCLDFVMASRIKNEVRTSSM